MKVFLATFGGAIFVVVVSSNGTFLAVGIVAVGNVDAAQR